MPTVFMHLEKALELADSFEWFSELPTSAKGAYLLGHIAPDVTTVTKEPRVKTHFFSPSSPSLRRLDPCREMLRRFPELLHPRTIEEKMFTFGLLGHLKADEIWMHEIGIRFFQKTSNPWNARERAILHDVFRIVLEKKSMQRIDYLALDPLLVLQEAPWYPLTEERFLLQWHQSIVRQIESKESDIVDVFADRLSLSVSDFLPMTQPSSEESHRIALLCPQEEIDRFWKVALCKMQETMQSFWEESSTPS